MSEAAVTSKRPARRSRRAGRRMTLIGGVLALSMLSSVATTALEPLEIIPPAHDTGRTSANQPDLSRRGETVVVRGLPRTLLRFGSPDAVEPPAPNFDGYTAIDRTSTADPIGDGSMWAATSGDGCVIVEVRPQSVVATAVSDSIVVTRWCTTDEATGERKYSSEAPASFNPVRIDGEGAPVPINTVVGQPVVDFAGNTLIVAMENALRHIDLDSRQFVDLEVADGYVPIAWFDNYGRNSIVDVSADGRHVVAAVDVSNENFRSISQRIHAWDVVDRQSGFVSPIGPRVRTPSLSHDGRFVSYVSDDEDVGGDRLYVASLSESFVVESRATIDLFGTGTVCAAAMNEDATQVIAVHENEGGGGGGCDLSEHNVTIAATDRTDR